jgi:hypothetical protein
MGGEGGTKALPETVETSQLGSHGSGHKTAEQDKDFQLAQKNQNICTINQVDHAKASIITSTHHTKDWTF